MGTMNERERKVGFVRKENESSLIFGLGNQDPSPKNSASEHFAIPSILHFFSLSNMRLKGIIGIPDKKKNKKHEYY